MSVEHQKSQIDSSNSFYQGTMNKIKNFITSITVEPGVFLLGVAANMELVPTKEMLLYKICINDFDYPEDICTDLLNENYTDINKEVQDEYAQFAVYEDLVSSIYPIFFAFYLGSWCDLFGRKLILYIYWTAKILGVFGNLLNAIFLDAKKEYRLLSLIPVALSGGVNAYQVGTNTFVSDISSKDMVTFRLAMVNLCYTMGGPVGIELAAYVLEQYGYVYCFAVSLVMLIISFIYMAVRLYPFKWESPKRKKNDWKGSFHPRQAWNSMKTTFKKRPNHARLYLMLLMGTMMSMTAPYAGENVISYIYTRTRFDWTATDFSHYRSFSMIYRIVGAMVMAPLLAFVNVNISKVLPFLVLTKVIRDALEAFAPKGWIFYLATCIDPFGSYTLQVIRGLMTLCAPVEELGQIFALWTSLDNCIPVAVAQIYQEIWTLTSDTKFVGTVYIISTFSTFIGFCIALFICIKLGSKTMDEFVGLVDPKRGIGTAQNTGQKDRRPLAIDQAKYALDPCYTTFL